MIATLRTVLVATLLCAGLSAAHAEKRVALVIGNSAYSKVEKLKNPANDARRLAGVLEEIGFDSVTLKLDQTYTALRRTLGKFSREAAGADIALIYFAGHGIEVGGTNYVIPTDAALSHVDDVEFEAVELKKLMSSLNRAGKLKLVILDACRNNPFKHNMASTGSTRSVGRGLARVDPTGSDTLVAYAAREGTVADDGAGENSPYASALIKHIATPGLDIRLMFGRVRDDVLASTGSRQEPFTYGSLGGSAIHLSALQVSQPQTESGASAATESSAEKLQSETRRIRQEAVKALWNIVKISSDPAVINSFIAQYPDSPFVDRARNRIKNLEKQQKTAALSEPSDSAAGISGLTAADLKNPKTVALHIQKELNRVGCDVGKPDGDWGNRSRRGLRAYARHAKVKLTGLNPSVETLKEIMSKRQVVCPPSCTAREVLKDGLCVVKVCPPGQNLLQNGTCQTPTSVRKSTQSAGTGSSGCRLETLTQCRNRIMRMSRSERINLPGEPGRKCMPHLRKKVCN